MKIQLVTVFMLFNVLMTHSQVNILESYNGDFENGLNYWRVFEVPENNGSYAVPVMDAASGNYAMQINYVSDYGTIDDRGFDNWLTKVPVDAGVTYNVKAFVKGDSNMIAGLAETKVVFGFFDAEQNAVSQVNRSYILTEEYEEISFSKKAPTRAVSCWLGFRLFDATNPCADFRSMYLDHVRILRPYAVSDGSQGPVDSNIQLLSNYPNPFNKETTIAYELDKPCTVTLRIFNVFGQEIAILADQQKQNTGRYQVVWTPGDVPKGIYFYSLNMLSPTGKEYIFTNKMMLER